MDQPASHLDRSGIGDQAVAPGIPPPIRREHYLSRFGPAATLMTVEHIRAQDGSERRRLRFERWPGL